MALISPILDDRTFEQLRDELVRRIPVYTPEWTDHNETDPGIALLELFAYLGESLLFRFNQIPDATKIEFLRLLGVQPRPARPARCCSPRAPRWPRGYRSGRGPRPRPGRWPSRWRTRSTPGRWTASRWARRRRPAPGPRPTATGVPTRWPGSGPCSTPGVPTRFYETTAVPADPNAPDAVPLDVAATLDQSLWVALLRRKTTDPTQLGGRTLFVGVAFDETVDRAVRRSTEPHHRRRGRLPLHRADPRAAGDALGAVEGPGGAGLGTADHPARRGARHHRGLATTGVVTLTLPATLPAMAPPTGPATGGADSPPPLADEKQAAAVVAWLRCRRRRTPAATTRSTGCAGSASTPSLRCRRAPRPPSCSAAAPATPISATR